ncbi:leucyl aminopeptidase, partial [Tsukamurella tyrosinosolvens]
MSTPFTGPAITLTDDLAAATDALVVGVYSAAGDGASITLDGGVPEAARGPVAEALALLGAEGKAGEAVRIATPAGSGLG